MTKTVPSSCWYSIWRTSGISLTPFAVAQSSIAVYALHIPLTALSSFTSSLASCAWYTRLSCAHTFSRNSVSTSQINLLIPHLASWVFFRSASSTITAFLNTSNLSAGKLGIAGVSTIKVLRLFVATWFSYSGIWKWDKWERILRIRSPICPILAKSMLTYHFVHLSHHLSSICPPFVPFVPFVPFSCFPSHPSICPTICPICP